MNFERKTKGDYSPTTALLASGGCLIRLFTITQLADSDPILIFSFGIAFLLNFSLLTQIVYYGTMVENLSIGQVFAADISSSTTTTTKDSNRNSDILPMTVIDQQQQIPKGSLSPLIVRRTNSTASNNSTRSSS